MKVPHFALILAVVALAVSIMAAMRTYSNLKLASEISAESRKTLLDAAKGEPAGRFVSARATISGVTETPHLADGRWEVTQRWPGHPFVRWSWVWDGWTDEPTVHLEWFEHSRPNPPPRFITPPDPDFEPGISPHNL